MEPDDLRVLKISEKCSRLTKYVGCCVERVRYVTLANLNVIRYTTGIQCNCLNRGSDGEKRGGGGGFITMRVKQFCTR